MKVRSKSSGKAYDVDYLVAEDHAFSLSEVDIEDTPTSDKKMALHFGPAVDASIRSVDGPKIVYPVTTEDDGSGRIHAVLFSPAETVLLKSFYMWLQLGNLKFIHHDDGTITGCVVFNESDICDFDALCASKKVTTGHELKEGQVEL